MMIFVSAELHVPAATTVFLNSYREDEGVYTKEMDYFCLRLHDLLRKPPPEERRAVRQLL